MATLVGVIHKSHEPKLLTRMRERADIDVRSASVNFAYRGPGRSVLTDLDEGALPLWADFKDVKIVSRDVDKTVVYEFHGDDSTTPQTNVAGVLDTVKIRYS